MFAHGTAVGARFAGGEQRRGVSSTLVHRDRQIAVTNTRLFPGELHTQLITSVGCSRMMGPAGSPSGPAASARASALPRIITHRGRHGGSTSSTTKATFGLRWALRNFRLRAKSRPPMSIVSSSEL